MGRLLRRRLASTDRSFVYRKVGHAAQLKGTSVGGRNTARFSTMSKVAGVSPILSVRDIGQSFEWFEALGWERSFSWNDGGMMGDGANAPSVNEHGVAHFAGICSGDVTLFLCLEGQGPLGDGATDGVWMSWWMPTKADVDRMWESARAKGFMIPMDPRDEPWGVREFHLRHPDGHVFRVSSGVD